jgi:hypothetical protein
VGRAGALIEQAVGQEPDIGAVQGGGKPVRHSGQHGDDLVEVLPRRGHSSRAKSRAERREPWLDLFEDHAVVVSHHDATHISGNNEHPSNDATMSRAPG